VNKINVRKNNVIVFIGDSITDCERMNPIHAPFGYGYVHFAANWLLAHYPELDLNIINTGISGNTVRDLKGRWEKDCIGLKPDVLSILIGINDCWRQHREPNRLPDAVLPDEYEQTYRQLLKEVTKKRPNCQLVLIEPFMFCDDENNAMLRNLQNYIGTVHKLAAEFDALLIPMQALVTKALTTVPGAKWSADMVHPVTWAHAWIAQKWLESTNL
jgi:acyl-CoA thioesterase I